MLEGFYLRRPQIEDLEAVLALMLACDRRDVGFPDSDMDDLQSDWNRIDLLYDAWLVFDKNHFLQGYGAVLPWTQGKLVAVYDAPGTEKTDLFLALSILCEGRARSLLQHQNDKDRSMIAQYISDSAAYQKKILLDAGYELTKFLFNIHRFLDEDVAQPAWPQQYQLRTIKIGADEQSLHALIEDAFAKPGRLRQSFSEWKTWMMNPLTFIPDIWFVLEHKKEIIACVLCFEYEDMGWVRQLAVRKDHRRKGLGAKLLQHSFAVFQQRGFTKVGLAVEAENTHALDLYQKVGMKKAVHLDEFAKQINV